MQASTATAESTTSEPNNTASLKLLSAAALASFTGVKMTEGVRMAAGAIAAGVKLTAGVKLAASSAHRINGNRSRNTTAGIFFIYPPNYYSTVFLTDPACHLLLLYYTTKNPVYETVFKHFPGIWPQINRPLLNISLISSFFII